MSWFSFTDIAKNALTEAQKKIDKALDIQGHEKETGVSTKTHGESKTAVVENLPNVVEPGCKTEPNSIKKADFSSKKKTRAARPIGSTFGAKKLSSSDLNEDFFSILNDESSDITSKKRATNSASDESFSEIPLVPPKQDVSPPRRDTTQIQPRVDDLPTKITPTTPDEKSDDDSTEKDVASAAESLESSYSEVALTVSSEERLIDEPKDQKPLDGGEEPVETNLPLQVQLSGTEDNPTEQCLDNILPKQEESLKAASFEDVDLDRAVSPSVSTAASSEIDILDHESTTSEISSTSKFADGLNFIQSPIHIPNIDTVDSDASQALSPTPDGKDGYSTALASSPPRIYNEKPYSDSVHSPIANHSLQCTTKSSFDNAAQQRNESAELTESVPDKSSNCHFESGKNTVTPATKTAIENDETKVQKSGAADSAKDESKYIVLNEKMEIYEQQLLTLSRKNAQLNEENDNLRSEIIRAEEECRKQVDKEMQNALESAKTCENNNKLLKEEKSNLTKQIAVLKSQLASRMTNEQVQNTITEKEQSIKGLMEEGEVLSKKHLQQNNLIKKLKSQTQEREADLKATKEKLAKYEEENKKMKDELLLLRGQGEEEREASLRISDAYEQRERQTFLLQEKLTESEEKQRTLQVNLDMAYREIGDMHKQKAEQDSKTKADWTEREQELRRETDIEIKKIISEQEHQRQLLMLQIYELNNNMERSGAMVARKEDEHRREIRELQQQLQESEARNQDLSDNVSSATRPLLRQIENLQATHSSQQRSWNALEKTLNNRLGEAQADLLAAQDNERMAQSTAMEAKSKALAFEKTIESDKKNLAKQEQEIDSLKKQVTSLKEETVSLSDELANLKATHRESVDKSRRERLSLENQLQMEKVRSEAERKKYQAQQETLQREKDRVMWSRSEITSISSNQIAETESVGSSNDAFHSADLLEKQLSTSSLTGLSGRPSFDSRSLSMSNVLENLQMQLKLRDGELAQLRGEINMLERTRSSMAEEIVRLTNLNEDMDGVSKELQEVKEKLVEVEGRYGAILTMYGEKEEENEELKMDLEDIKAMYKQQINDLLRPDRS